MYDIDLLCVGRNDSTIESRGVRLGVEIINVMIEIRVIKRTAEERRRYTSSDSIDQAFLGLNILKNKINNKLSHLQLLSA